MVEPKNIIANSNKTKYEIKNIDYDTHTVTALSGKRHITFSFSEVNFDFSDMDLDDMYAFLRAIYSPKDVVKKMCDARGVE